MYEKISVVISTFNRYKYLKEAVQSVLDQSFQDFEIIIVNDNPVDKDFLNKYVLELNDERIIIIHHEIQKGGNAARNTGILNSKYDIVALLDDDDIWFPEKLEKHLNVHNSKNADLVYSGCVLKWDNNFFPESSYYAKPVPNNIITDMLNFDFCPTCISVVRDCFERIGYYDEKLISYQDWDLGFTYAGKCNLYPVPEPLLIARQHFNSRTSESINTRLKGFNQLNEKWIRKGFNINEKEALKRAFFVATRNYSLQSDKLNSLKYFIKYIRTTKITDLGNIAKLALMVININFYKYLVKNYKKIKNK